MKTNKLSKPPCIGLEDYYQLTTVKDKADWLVENGENVCENILKEEIINTHSINSADIDNPHPLCYTIEWGTLQEVIEGNFYNVYLGFDFDSNLDVEDIKLIPEFMDTTPCYSIPFLQTIANELAVDDFVEFRRAELDKVSVLVVITKDKNGTALGYYDASSSPL